MQNRNNPHFILFPMNNARTGYRPYSMPVVYIEPRRFDPRGNGIPDSETLRLSYKVVDAPDPAKVAGQFNQNIRIPSQSLFEIEVSPIELSKRTIDVRGFQFFDNQGNEKFFINAVDGDYFRYTVNGSKYTKDSNPESLIPYYSDAVYYDLSDFAIDVEQLPKPKRYLFVWESFYFRRFDNAIGGFKCISNEVAISSKSLDVNHPGDIHEFMFKSTPGFYFDYENFSLKDDTTLEFYRPFADILQDVFDEQELLDGINHVNSVPSELIPYLSFLVGFDLPNFPGTTDQLRRTILKRATELQKLKSSRRVINELFETFGFIIDIINLHNSLDGNSLLAPGEIIQSSKVLHTDLMLSDYDSGGFGVGSVPLLHPIDRDSKITLHAWMVDPGSVAHDRLIEIVDIVSSDLGYLEQNTVPISQDGFAVPSFVNQVGNTIMNGIVGYSAVEINDKSKSIGRPIINHRNIKYDKNNNVVDLIFDHELSVDSDFKVFVFASYSRNKIVIPSELSNTISNKFDIEILDRDGLPVDYILLLSLIDFLFKLKSFHSLLRKIKTSVRITEVYNVTDMCIDGQDTFKPSTALGELQTPPGIIPLDTTGCVDDNDRGFKKEDLALRKTIIDGLEHEFQAWKLLSDDCSFTPDGQDKVLSDDGVDFDHEDDIRQTLCGDNPDDLNYCYKGRVQDLFDQVLAVVLKENYKCNPCELNMGNVVYWTNTDKNDLDDIFSSKKKFKNFGNEQLYFSDSQYLKDKIFKSNNNLALNPFSIEIEKDNLNFPSHRLMSMDKLLNDYSYTQEMISDGYDKDYVRKRPWDDSTDCGAYDTLNAKIVEDTSGNEVLVWDEDNLVYLGNGFIPDIPSLSNHGPIDARVITHSVYQNAPQSHPSVTFCQTVFVPHQEKIDTSALKTGAIFNTVCPDDDLDYIGGYPSSIDYITVSGDKFEDGPTGQFIFCDDVTCQEDMLDRNAISELFNMPDSINNTESRFLSGSMEYVLTSDIDYGLYIPFRLDCGNIEQCEDDLINDCNLCLNDSDGNFDGNCDKIDFDIKVALQETMSLCSRLSNGEIENLFCLNEECTIDSNGMFEYQDDYGIIYETQWKISLDLLDITVVRKDPRIPLQEAEGRMEFTSNGIEIYRKGVIVAVRQIIRCFGDDYFVEAEGYESYIDEFRVNKICGENPFDNPFAKFVNCAISDNVSMLVTIGPHWQGDEGISQTEYKWTGDGTSSTSGEDLVWM